VTGSIDASPPLTESRRSKRSFVETTTVAQARMPIDPASYRVVILAAGRGRRLGANAPPKALLNFQGGNLFARHLRILGAHGVRDINVVVGYRADEFRAEVRRLQNGLRVGLIENSSFRDGSIVSLWHVSAVLRSGAPVILMDADVLYDERLIVRLLGSPHENCFLLDRSIEPGDEPVKLCIDKGRIVDFHKRPRIDHEWHGESVGFFRFSPVIAAELANRAAQYIAAGRTRVEYEEPIRDMVVAQEGVGFGYEDISGLPWIEIDFPSDVETARRIVVPQLLT
jgi:choline kinase